METDIQTMMSQASETLGSIAVTYGLSLVGAIIILLLGFWAAGWASRATERGLRRITGVDETLTRFLGGLARYGVIAVTILAVLSEFGVQTASLLAVLGAAGLAIGLALQGTLSNVAAGVMLLVLRPFKIGDFVGVGSVEGTVKDLSLFRVAISTPDNVEVFVPNSDVWSSPIRNFNFNGTRRIEIVCGISYDDDITTAIDVMKRVVGTDPRVLDDPAPVYAVKSLGDSSVDVMARVWVKSDDYWPFTFDKTREVKEGYDAAGLTIPFPTRLVHRIEEAAD